MCAPSSAQCASSSFGSWPALRTGLPPPRFAARSSRSPPSARRPRLHSRRRLRLTNRSSGRPPASRLGRYASSVIIRSAAQAPRRRPPLSSNVRQQRAAAAAARKSAAAAEQPSQSVERRAGARRHQAQTLLHRRRSRYRGEQPSQSFERRAGARRVRQEHELSSQSHGRCVEDPELEEDQKLHCKPRRSGFLHGQFQRLHSRLASRASGCRQRCQKQLRTAARELLPNPSLERTATGKPLGPLRVQCHHPLRGPSASPASAAQLKR